MMRNLLVILGDQLNRNSSVFDGFEAGLDAVWMAEVAGEAEHVWSGKMRTVLFLSAMRHFRDELRAEGITVHYRQLNDAGNLGSLGAELKATAGKLKPEGVVVTEPGEWRVREELVGAVPELEVREDRHFFCSRAKFKEWVGEKKQLRMEFFYRTMRVEYGVLLDGSKPVGGKWNYDPENRGSFGKAGPANLFGPATFTPDAVTVEVQGLVNTRFAGHPGSCEAFDYPVTRAQALVALSDFMSNRLAEFGKYQDAMWTGEALLFHSRLSAALNLKLLDPREVVGAAEEAYKRGTAELAATEGFIRQILGWREYVRGVYWMLMPEYLERNHLEASETLPKMYWTGETDMRCMAEALGQTLRLGYAHHIHRLMVTGLFALLYGVEPKQVHGWYLGVYVDAVEWAELPNTLGMSQYGDGGVMASKPYCASGKYIQRMSNYCGGCKYDPAERVGADACPFTTLYWDFLLRHEGGLRGNQRMGMQLKNLERLGPEQRVAIQMQAAGVRNRYR